MHFPSIRSIRSQESHRTVRYTSYSDDEEDDASFIPPPPPPPPPTSPPPADYPTLPPWPDDVSAMTSPSGVSGMAAGETPGATPTPSKQSLEGERYLEDDVESSRTPSASAAIELKLAIYDRLEKRRRVEMDLVKDEKNKRNSRNQKLCIVIVLFFALLALSIGLGLGLKSRDKESRDKNATNDSASDNESPGTMTEDPVTIDDLSIMLVGVSPELELSNGATTVLEDEYCKFFVTYYNEPQETDSLRSNVDVESCKIEIQPNRRMLSDLDDIGYIVPFSQTFALSYPKSNAKNGTLVNVSMEYIVAAPFEDDLSVPLLVDNLKNSIHTDIFIELQDVAFDPSSRSEPNTSTPSTLAVTSAPSVSPSQSPVSRVPTVAPTSSPPTLSPTPEPSKPPRNKDRDEDQDKDKKKKKNKDKFFNYRNKYLE
mmetsp:Transcript_13158/g.28558  ORF Transcript_13158/g.28558 Transcript_13158/m.28558 type:complete len:427 (+) Transcript_13158:113-1393(+)